jgi:hypothetical protein
MSKARIAGEMIFVFQNAKRDAAVAGAKLRAAGFEFKVMPDTDPESADTVFAMVWRDYPPKALGVGEYDLVVQFIDQVEKIAGDNWVDTAGLVESDHVPKFFGDFYGAPILPQASA